MKRTSSPLALTPGGYPAPGRVVVITGASSGIGAATARRAHQLGAHVIPVGRDPERTAAVTAEVGGSGEPLTVDFARLETVHRLAEKLLAEHPRIDVLALNAGATVPERTTTLDGHELTFQLNHLGPFLLLQLLAGRLAAARGSVVFTSSAGHLIGALDPDDLDSSRRRYWAPRVYGTAKLTNVLTAREVSRRLPGITASSFHPGIVRSGFGDNARGSVGWIYRNPIGQRLTITSERGAEPLVALVTHPDPATADRLYFNRLRVARPSRSARDEALSRQLWDRSLELLRRD